MRALRVVFVLACLGIAVGVDAGLAPTKSSQLVTLTGGGACPSPGIINATAVATRVAADGTAGGFVIPPKQVLVLNEILVSANSQIGGDPFVVAVLVVGPGATNYVAVTHTTAPGAGLGVTFTPPTGIAVKAGSTVCVQMGDLNHALSPITPTAVAYGFLAPDK